MSADAFAQWMENILRLHRNIRRYLLLSRGVRDRPLPRSRDPGLALGFSLGLGLNIDPGIREGRRVFRLADFYKVVFSTQTAVAQQRFHSRPLA